jgi:hypothetical protein
MNTQKSSWEVVVKKISECAGIPVNSVPHILVGDWHEDTRYVDGGFDFHQSFELNSRWGTAYYSHTNHSCQITWHD